jgi:hypothetical protein
VLIDLTQDAQQCHIGLTSTLQVREKKEKSNGYCCSVIPPLPYFKLFTLYSQWGHTEVNSLQNGVQRHRGGSGYG